MTIKNIDKEYCPNCKKDVDYKISSEKIKVELLSLFNLVPHKECLYRFLEEYKENKNDL